MGNLTKNFSLQEFKCSCCGMVNVDLRLVDALQDLRDLAKKPIHINCGCRCEDHNSSEKIKGAKNSRHLFNSKQKTQAADIVIEGLNPVDMYQLACRIKMFEHGGIGIYHTMIHVDIRNYKARWARIDGEYTSLANGIKYHKKGK